MQDTLYAICNLKGYLIPLGDLPTRINELDTAKEIIVHCKVGQRGHTATRLLQQYGVTAANLDGGWLTWQAGRAATAEAVPNKED